MNNNHAAIPEEEMISAAAEPENNAEIDVPDDASLNLDPSLLLDRDSVATYEAIMDRYVIRIFDEKAEEQISRYQQEVRKRENFYKRMVFRVNNELADRELNVIRSELFALSYTPSRIKQNNNETKSSFQNPGLIVVLCLLVTGISIGYGRVKRKERERKLADFNNSYDE